MIPLLTLRPRARPARLLLRSWALVLLRRAAMTHWLAVVTSMVSQ